MHPFDVQFDDYSPADMEKRVETASKNKAQLNFLSLLMLAILAGSFIALGAQFYTVVTFDSNLSIGITRLVGGVAFSLGLILVIVAGAELFTGNNLIMMGIASGVVTYRQMLKNWLISYIGNFLGSISVVYLIYLTNLWKAKDCFLGASSVLIAASKVNLSFMEGFSRGILCNALVCLAVWLCFSARTVISKIAAIIFPITAFVASGFEHSIANMYFIPLGMLLKNNPEVNSALIRINPGINLSNLNILGFLGNLFSVTIGNIIGGAVMVGVVYWIIIVLPIRLKKKNDIFKV
ncbi:MAG: formate/nitrite transporter family protein [Actinomycetia bacterium]|nr:formate/nitrite transporter family protein [Actinomycetes bacterium]